MDLAGHGRESSKYILKLKVSLYGLKQASMNWHSKLKKAFEDRGFVEFLSDPCVYISEDMIILVYVDDCILISKDTPVIEKFISSLKAGTENFVFAEEGTMNSYLGVDISSLSDKKGFVLSQPFLIKRIIQVLNFDPKTTKSATNNTPVGYPLLNKDEDGLPRKASWEHWGVIGMLGYLQNTTRPDIAMVTHQCARSNQHPRNTLDLW